MQAVSTIKTITDFYASKLGNFRTIYIYLPPGYGEEPDRRYPVLYMHAGQRAFQQTHPEGDSWKIDETCDRLIAEGRMEKIMIVAISHVRPVASNEFYHFKAPAEEAATIACTGIEYEHFIVHELKPYVDAHYSTLPDAANTALLGASAGGLSTYHIGFRHPEHFGKLLMLSPYFIKAGLDEHSTNGLREEPLYRDYNGHPSLRIWLDIGDAEGLFLPEHVRSVVDRLLDNGFQSGDEIAFLLQPDAAHEEPAWAERVEMPLLYMFGQPSRPVSLELQGGTRVGLQGRRPRLNPIIRYENGLAMTVLNGEFRSEHPEVLDIGADGALLPKREGQARLWVKAEGLEATGMFEVVASLSELVSVTVTAELAPGIEPTGFLYGGMGMKLAHAGEGRYTGRFLVPRDSGYQFRFTQGFRRFELDAQGKRMPNRRIRADRELDLNYRIERFAQPKPSEAERRHGNHGGI